MVMITPILQLNCSLSLSLQSKPRSTELEPIAPTKANMISAKDIQQEVKIHYYHDAHCYKKNPINPLN